MRPLLVTSEPAAVRQGSGTAVAVRSLVAALAAVDVELSIQRHVPGPLGHTVARWAARRAPLLGDHDVVLGVGGDGCAAARQAGVPFVALPKALYAEVRPFEPLVPRTLLALHQRWEAEASRHADLVVVPSRAAGAAVAARYGVPQRRIEVIGEALMPRSRGREARRSPRPRRVLLVAHLYARKRVGDLLAAWPLVRRHRPDVTLDIAGGGPQGRQLAAAARDLPGVRLHGHVSPALLDGLYATADLAVSTSAHETFGYAVLEALAAGLPVVVAAAPAVVELCTGAVAQVVPVGDVGRLAEAVMAALDDDVCAAAARINPSRTHPFAPALVGSRYREVLRAVTAPLPGTRGR